MGAKLVRAAAGVIVVSVLTATMAWAQSAENPASLVEAEPPASTPDISTALKAEQLQQLLAPIALYPDALLAQILMAATYPLEIVKARRWLQAPGHAALSGDQLAAALEAEPWDPSVKSLLPFPRILQVMDDQLDWTEQLGNAFVAQQASVMDAIQVLRHEAAAAGTLWSGAQQRVATEGQGIVIEPVNPEMIYPPVYNPTAVYGPWPNPDYPPPDFVPSDYDVGFASPFGIGFSEGVAVVRPLWRWCTFDWTGRRIQLNVDRFNSLNRNHSRAGSSIWRHDPSRRAGTPSGDLAFRAPFGKFPVHASSPPVVSGATISVGGSIPPTIVLRASPPGVSPAGRGLGTRISPQPNYASRQMLAPTMMPRHFVPPMMPRAFTRTGAPETAARSGGGSHR